jgi:hypothetical protein
MKSVEQRVRQVKSAQKEGLKRGNSRGAGAGPTGGRGTAAKKAGLSQRQHKTAVRVANVPDAEFEAAVESPTPPTVTELAEHRLREREPFVPTLCHAFRACDLDDGRAHVRTSYFARCLPKKAKTLLQPSIACSGR